MTATSHLAGPERRSGRVSPLAVGLALAAIVGVAMVTLCPIDLRPHVAPANVERFGAYAVVGLLVSLAAGRRRLEATALVMLIALGLEATQALIPTRHAAASDALVKALGGVIGCFAGQLLFPLRRLVIRLIASQPQPASAILDETTA